MILNDAQQTAYDRLSDDWTTVGKPEPVDGSDRVVVEVSKERPSNYSHHGYYTVSKWLGIEDNGSILG